MWKHTEPTKICMYHAKWRNKNCNLCHEAFILGDDFKEETINVVILLKYWELVTPSFEIEQYLHEFNFISLCTPLCQNCFLQVGLSSDTWNTFCLKSMKVKILHLYNGYINNETPEISAVLVLEFRRSWGDVWIWNSMTKIWNGFLTCSVVDIWLNMRVCGF